MFHICVNICVNVIDRIKKQALRNSLSTYFY